MKEFYRAHGTCPQTFLKYYARYCQSGRDIKALLPQKRGPRFHTRRTSEEIESAVLPIRDRGCNKYEIHSILKAQWGDKTPSPSGIYKILKRYGKNRLTRKVKETKRRTIKEKAGELGHIDCHHLSRDTITNDNKKYYLVAVVDSCTRLAWAEVVDDVQALTVTFAALRCFNFIAQEYDVRFAEVLTDNGPEFGPKNSKRKAKHPFERLSIAIRVLIGHKPMAR